MNSIAIPISCCMFSRALFSCFPRMAFHKNKCCKIETKLCDRCITSNPNGCQLIIIIIIINCESWATEYNAFQHSQISIHDAHFIWIVFSVSINEKAKKKLDQIAFCLF